MTPQTSPEWARRLTYATALALGLAVALMGYAGSFTHLRAYGAAHGFPFGGAALPIGLDLGIPALLLLDWHRPSMFLRAAAWTLAGWTVIANGAVGGGTLTDRLIHAMMPALAAVIIESARHLREDPSRMDRIRWSRLIVSPVRTIRLRARMISWEVTSYSEALRLESAILYARAVLRAEYGGRSWKQTRDRVPVILVHELRTGQLPAELAYAADWRLAVRDWIRQTLDELDPNRNPGPADTDRTEAVPEPVPVVVVEREPWDRVWDRLNLLDSDGLTPEQLAHAYALARRHFEQVGRHIVADKLRSPIGIGKPKALTLATTLKTAYETEIDRRSPDRSPDPTTLDASYPVAETGHGPAGTSSPNSGLTAAEATL